jgi:hypothetical protein
LEEEFAARRGEWDRRQEQLDRERLSQQPRHIRIGVLEHAEVGWRWEKRWKWFEVQVKMATTIEGIERIAAQRVGERVHLHKDTNPDANMCMFVAGFYFGEEFPNLVTHAQLVARSNQGPGEPGSLGQQEEPLPAVPGESFKTMLSMGTPWIAHGASGQRTNEDRAGVS